MRLEFPGAPGAAPAPDEAAAIAAALAALLSEPVESETPAAPPSRWRLAARAFDEGYDAERALRRARRRSS
jgi:hypothetical protein